MLENFALLEEKTAMTKTNSCVLSIISNGHIQFGSQILMGASPRLPHLKIGEEVIPFEFVGERDDLLQLPVQGENFIFKRVKDQNRYVLKSIEETEKEAIENLDSRSAGLLRFIATTSEKVVISEENNIRHIHHVANNAHSDYLIIFWPKGSCVIRHENSELKVSYESQKKFLIEKK